MEYQDALCNKEIAVYFHLLPLGRFLFHFNTLQPNACFEGKQGPCLCKYHRLSQEPLDQSQACLHSILI